MKETKLIHFDGEYQYNLEIENDSIYKLYHNNSEIWQEYVKGTLCFEMINDGNQWTYKTEKKGTLNYSESLYIYIILAFDKDYKLEIATIEREL